MYVSVPRRHDADASLETVDLDADEDELENFLGDVPNASPLPKDEEADKSQSVSLDDDELVDEFDNKLAIPRAESMYYTPSDTLEDIAGAVEEDKVKVDGIGTGD